MKKTIHSAGQRAFLRLLREFRRETGLTQEELAGRLGETQSFVSKCERGERRLDVIELHQFCEAMEISLMDFVARFLELSERRKRGR